MLKGYKNLALAFLFLVFTYTSFQYLRGPVSSTYTTIYSTGIVLGQTGGEFGVHWDATGTSEVTSINWGTLEPGGNATKTLWIKNEDDIPIQLTFSTTNWEPVEAEDYLTLSWTFGDTPLYPSMSRRVYVTLMVDESITEIYNFNFDIMLSS